MSKREAAKKHANSALNHLYKYTSEYSDDGANGSNRRLASGAAASLFGMGLDAFHGKDKVKDFDEYLIELDTKSSNKTSHFTDRLLEKLINNAMAEDDPEKLILEQKFKDPERANRPNLSIKILISNFKNLASRMSLLFELQYGIIHIVTWKRPAKTLSVLVLYTWICLWPHLILAYPLLFLIFSVMIPGYLYRHPERTPEFIKVKKRGQTIFEFLSQSHANERSILEDMIRDVEGEERVEIMKDYDKALEHKKLKNNDEDPMTTDVADPDDAESIQPTMSASSEATEDENKEEKKVSNRSKSRFTSQITLLMNMKDLQNLMTDIIAAFDKAEIFWYQTGGFKDETLSTLIFYVIIMLTGVVLFFGPYIPWRIIFILSGWAILLIAHPGSAKHIKKFQQKPSTKRRTVEVKETIERVERQDIIIDDSAEVKKVEIFELHRKNMTGNGWSFYCYTNTLFDIKDHMRTSGKRPEGVEHLGKIQPPKDWKFDIGYVNEWVTDLEPTHFIASRSLDEKSFYIPKGKNDGWIYDNVEDLDSLYQFRRRRMSRDCFRYSRPPKEPKRQKH